MSKHVHIVYSFHILDLYDNRFAVKRTFEFEGFNYGVVIFFTGIFTPEHLWYALITNVDQSVYIFPASKSN